MNKNKKSNLQNVKKKFFAAFLRNNEFSSVFIFTVNF